jgi:SAM-dependent methyltransferase
MEQQESFWESPDVVRRFSERDPDHRLREMAATLHPGETRVLDVGCAGGRNTVFLAELGVHVEALDASAGMVEETRRRLAAVVGAEAARARVRQGRMDDLSAYPSASFDLVLGLGIYQNAASMQEWERAIAETARVLRPGGRVLVAHFTPDLDMTGHGVESVPGEPHVFTGLADGRAVLLYQDELEEAMARHGLEPLTPSRTVVVETNPGRRSTVNALLVRRI